MNVCDVWYKATLFVAAFQWAACLRYSTPRCDLHSVRSCPTLRQEDMEHYDGAYVKLCQGAINATLPPVSGAEAQWDKGQVNIYCGDEGMMEMQEYLSNTTFLRADNNVVELETLELVTRDYCISVLPGKSPDGEQAPARKEPRERRGLSVGSGREGGDTVAKEMPEFLTLGTQQTEPDPQYIAHFCKMAPHVQRSRDRQVCARAPCVRKCCPQGKFLRSGRTTHICIYSHNDTENWTPHVSSHIREPDSISHFQIIYSIPFNVRCYKWSNFSITANGYLELEGNVQVSQEDYCIDYQEQKTDGVQEVARLCLDPNACDWKMLVFDPVLMGVSCVFLAATAAVYIFLAELRRANSSRCIVAMALTTLITYIIVIVHKFTRDYIKTNAIMCSATGFLNLSFILSQFFWINVLCYDMWKTIRSGHGGSGRSWQVFFRYGAYAWGCPALLATLALLLDAFLDVTHLRPGFNDGVCWFSSNEARWAYKDGIILILMVINCGFFLHIAYILYKKLNNKDLRNETSRTTHHITKWKTFAKLFIVMGVIWVLELFPPKHPLDACVWWRVLFSFLTRLQGVAVFMVTVCNRDKCTNVRCIAAERSSSHLTLTSVISQGERRLDGKEGP